MNQIMFDLDRPGPVDTGSCKLHIYHNAFTAALKEYGNGIITLVIDLLQWFELCAARQEDYQKVQHSLGIQEHKFL